MPAPRLRSRSFRRVHKKLPGGRTTVHYERKKPKAAKCGGCGAVLKGIAKDFPYKMQNMPKTRKRPQRAYGGVLCTRCSREFFKGQARV